MIVHDVADLQLGHVLTIFMADCAIVISVGNSTKPVMLYCGAAACFHVPCCQGPNRWL